ncbi:capsule biosynthesis GfcC family protein [Cycloclasticus pugetii]|uniref:capsule biosynthesis GfcC family protein n=1 Tax=Cycloclasticus pugetii TaxID=34068 RepID=UPI003A95D438
MRLWLKKLGFKPYALVACLAYLPGAAQAQVVGAEPPANITGVHIGGEVIKPGTYDFPPGARLHDASVTGQINSRAWFLGAALLRESALEEQQRLKVGLLFELNANRIHALALENAELHELITRLYRTVAAMPVTGRTVAQLDPLQQLILNNNALLESGDRLLYPRKAEQVRVTGAVKADCVLPHDPSWQMHDYLKACQKHPLADRNSAYLIQPNGTWQEYGIAYWNLQPTVVATGAVIYLPTQPNKLSPATRDLNSDMAAMLATQYQLGGRFSE